MYREGQDFANFLSHFEVTCQMAGFSKDSNPVRLSSILTGKPSEIFVSLYEGTESDYDMIKKLLLLAIKESASQYRQDFKDARHSHDESSH